LNNSTPDSQKRSKPPSKSTTMPILPELLSTLIRKSLMNMMHLPLKKHQKDQLIQMHQKIIQEVKMLEHNNHHLQYKNE